MEFFEADEPAPQRRPRPTRSRPGGDGAPPRPPSGNRDILVRRLIALGIGALVLVLLLLGVRGCLDARKERSFENYLRDLSAIATNTGQLSAEFFGLLKDPGNRTEITFQADVSSYRGSADELLRRVEGLDYPDQLEGAQDDLQLAFELRSQAMTEIANQMPDALGDKNRDEAREAISYQMRVLLASDVLYGAARTEIQEVLGDEGVAGDVPESIFLPDPIEQWLDDLELGALLARVAGGTGAAASGVHGTELSQTLIRPGNIALSTDTATTISGNGAPEIEASVLNGGDTEETEVTVSYELAGAGALIEGQGTIDRLDPGATETATIAIADEVPTGEELTLTVTVQPVNGETIIDNNQASYPVIFE